MANTFTSETIKKAIEEVKKHKDFTATETKKSLVKVFYKDSSIKAFEIIPKPRTNQYMIASTIKLTANSTHHDNWVRTTYSTTFENWDTMTTALEKLYAEAIREYEETQTKKATAKAKAEAKKNVDPKPATKANTKKPTKTAKPTATKPAPKTRKATAVDLQKKAKATK